jgi:protein tyrosine phosphatase (PTP) superfamily phosphohydrolase (DUF442 family)
LHFIGTDITDRCAIAIAICRSGKRTLVFWETESIVAGINRWTARQQGMGGSGTATVL